MELENLTKVLSTKILAEPNQRLKTKLAAVLVIIYGKEPTIVMTKRPKTMNQHAGEISFPGGTWKKEDDDLLATAIRETREEIDFDISRQQIIGQLQQVTTLNSGFTIIPFVATFQKIPKLRPNSEIEKIIHIPMFSLFKTLEDDLDPQHKSIQEMFTFRYQDKLIWGASARILKQIVNKIQKTRL